jgi:hypothetical protein
MCVRLGSKLQSLSLVSEKKTRPCWTGRRPQFVDLGLELAELQVDAIAGGVFGRREDAEKRYAGRKGLTELSLEIGQDGLAVASADCFNASVRSGVCLIL